MVIPPNLRPTQSGLPVASQITRPNRLIQAIALLILFNGCGPKSAPEVAIEAETKVPEPITYTLGEIEILPLPEGMQFVGVEVLILEEIPKDAQPFITKQNAILRDLAQPPKPAAETPEPESSPSGLAPSDAQRLTAEINQLKAAIPEPLESTFTVGSSSRNFTSRRSLYERFRDLVSRISIDDLEGTINPISAEMESVYTILKGEVESTPANSNRVYQARADIAWMALFSDYMQGYRRVVLNYDSLRRRAAFQARRAPAGRTATTRAPASPQERWKEFRFQDGARFDATVLRMTLGAEYLEKPGSFRVEGSGIPAARLETSLGPLFLNGDNSASWIRFSNIRVITETPGDSN